jgi:hypothetical protein
MADEQTKVEIGFGIGQVLSVKMSAEKLKELRQAVESGSGWFDLELAEGSVALNLATVVFIRVSDSAHSIGFSG